MRAWEIRDSIEQRLVAYASEVDALISNNDREAGLEMLKKLDAVLCDMRSIYSKMASVFALAEPRNRLLKRTQEFCDSFTS